MQREDAAEPGTGGDTRYACAAQLAELGCVTKSRESL
jgi:hypothetical protein